MPFIAGAVSVTFGTLTSDNRRCHVGADQGHAFQRSGRAVLWIGLKTGHNFFRFVFGKTFHYTEEGWYKLTRNVALFFLGTAIVNEVVRLGFDDFAHVLRSIAYSPASTSGFCSRFSSSCRSPAASSGGRRG